MTTPYNEMLLAQMTGQGKNPYASPFGGNVIPPQPTSGRFERHQPQGMPQGAQPMGPAQVPPHMQGKMQLPSQPPATAPANKPKKDWNQVFASPMFNMGMNLLAAGQDRRINPFTAALSGLDRSNTLRTAQSEAQRKQQEMYLKYQKEMREQNAPQSAAGKLQSDIKSGAVTMEEYEAQQAASRAPSSHAPVKVVDKDSPTGYRYVTREEALGMAAPATGMTLRTNPDGSVEFTTGGAKGGMTNSTTSGVQQDYLKSANMGMRLSAIQQSFNPEFTTYMGKLKAKGLHIKTKINPESLSPEDREWYGQYNQWKVDSFRNLSQILNELSGAAVSPAEFERIAGFNPDPENDDAVTFQTKMESQMKMARMAMARYKFILNRGLAPSEAQFNAIPLGSMPSIINERGAELEKAFTGRGLKGAELNSAVKKQIAIEFGL